MTVSSDPLAADRPKRPLTDWKRAARMVARGDEPEAIAAAIGVSEDRFWRHLRRSLRFRFLIKQARDRRRLLAELQCGDLGRAEILRRSLHAGSLDAETLRWLTEAMAGGGDTTVAQLGETGAPPPNQAFRARMAAERAELDAEFLRLKAITDADIAAGAAQRAKPQPALDRTGPGLDSSGPDLDPTRPDLSRSGPAPAVPALTDVPPPRPRPPSTALRWGQPPISIIDLTDMDGNPLPGVDWPKPRGKG